MKLYGLRDGSGALSTPGYLDGRTHRAYLELWIEHRLDAGRQRHARKLLRVEACLLHGDRVGPQRQIREHEVAFVARVDRPREPVFDVRHRDFCQRYGRARRVCYVAANAAVDGLRLREQRGRGE